LKQRTEQGWCALKMRLENAMEKGLYLADIIEYLCKHYEIDKTGDKAFRALFTDMDGDQTPLEHILTKHKHFIKLRVPEKELQAVELTIDGMEVNANAIYLVLKNELGKQIKTFQDADFYLTGLMRRTIIIPVSKTTPSPPQPPKLAVALTFPQNMVKPNWPQHALQSQDKVLVARSPMSAQDLQKTPAQKTPSKTS